MGVLLYYELCEKVWGGSPVTEQIEGGLESADLWNDMTCKENSSSDTQGESQVETQDPKSLEDVNDSDRAADISENNGDNGDVIRSNDDSEQATQQPVGQEGSSVNEEARVSKVTR